MKKTKKGYGKKVLSVSLSMVLMLGGTAPIQAADLFTDQAEESTSEGFLPADEENSAEENTAAGVSEAEADVTEGNDASELEPESNDADQSADDFSAGLEAE